MEHSKYAPKQLGNGLFLLERLEQAFLLEHILLLFIKNAPTMEDDFKNELVKKFSDATDIVTDPIKKRLAHPIASSFVLSWIVINWKPLFYFLLSGDPVKYKIRAIQLLYYNDWILNYLNYIILPAIFALLYTLFFDNLSNKINRYKKQDILDKYDHDKEIQVADLRAQRSVMIERKALNNVTADNMTIEQLNAQIASLKSEIIKKDDQITFSQVELEKRASALIQQTKKVESLESDFLDKQMQSSLNETFFAKNTIEILEKMVWKENEKAHVERITTEFIRFLENRIYDQRLLTRYYDFMLPMNPGFEVYNYHFALKNGITEDEINEILNVLEQLSTDIVPTISEVVEDPTKKVLTINGGIALRKWKLLRAVMSDKGYWASDFGN